MVIPKTFEILGHQVTVRFDKEYSEDAECHGSFSIGRSAIRLQPEDSTWTRKMVEHTFVHEMTHALLEIIGESKLSKNEKFVDLFAGALHQAINTMKGSQ